MNEISILGRDKTPGPKLIGERASEFSGAVGPQAVPRPPPRAAIIVLPVWGYIYVRQFLELSLPTLLGPGNVPAVVAALPTQFVILTSADDETFIREHPAFKRLLEVCATEIRLIDHLITDGNSSTTVTLAYTEVVRAAGEAMTDTCFFFLVSDYIMADGSLASALKRMQAGASAVVAGNFQIAREDALGWLQEKLRFARHGVALPPRELMHWALNHLHPTTLANIVNIPFSHNSHTNRLFWRVDGSTIVGRFYLMHMLCVRPELTNFFIGSSCDYSFVPEMCPSGNVEALTDSDDYLVIEMQARCHESEFMRPGPLKPRELAKSLNEWATSAHRGNIRHTVLFHAAEVPRQIERCIAEADAFIAQVARHLKGAPPFHRNHPYWRGAIAAFREATGREIKAEEWRYVLGLPNSPNWLIEWLLWRAKHVLSGRPPYVKPWHPVWPDYRAVLKELNDFFIDRKKQLLMLSHGPTAFSLALADGGERVRRLRCMPFLQMAPERFRPMHGKFDLCLLELSEGDMQYGDKLVDRIVPLMKQDGRIVLYVINQRSLETVTEFANSVSYQAARFIRSGAVPIEIRFVLANRLRWAVRRGMVKLQEFTNSHAWLGVPAAVLGGAVLACLSLLGNLDVLRRSHQVAPRGIASSLVMRLIADAPRLGQTYAYSRFQLGRRNIAASKAQYTTSALPPTAAVVDGTREPQYNRCLELQNTVGLTTLGLMTNQLWHDDPRRLTFLLSRYKFVAKILSGHKNAGEVGCGDAFGTRIVLQEVPDVTVYDFDPLFIQDISERYDERWPLKAEVHDIVAAVLPRKHDALFSLDVLEHIAPEDEHSYLNNLCESLSDDGMLVIGTPSLESQPYASPPSKAGHINCKTGKELKALLEYYFAHVFIFSMNDEVVHTGFWPMAHYLFAVCSQPKTLDRTRGNRPS
jgi:hypothetical protein